MICELGGVCRVTYFTFRVGQTLKWGFVFGKKMFLGILASDQTKAVAKKFGFGTDLRRSKWGFISFLNISWATFYAFKWESGLKMGIGGRTKLGAGT